MRKTQGLNAGADDYLAKPFSARELAARISSNLKLSRIRPRAEVALRDSEQQFQVLADNIRLMPGWPCRRLGLLV